MAENRNTDSLGEGLRSISRGDDRIRIIFDEETGDFVMADADSPIEEGSQDATRFAAEGYA